jgi:hypothetical protein
MRSVRLLERKWTIACLDLYQFRSIGPNEEAKDLKSYIDSDMAAFKQRFKNGVVQEETSLSLPQAKLQAPVLTFRSGEKKNTVEGGLCR